MSEAPLNHPGDEALRALSLGQLTEEELAHVSAHLVDCPACCRRIDQLASDDDLLARLQQRATTPEKTPVSRTQRRSAVRALCHAHEAKSATRKRDADAVPVILPAPKQVGDYDILVEVGRGGMGVVYKARHRSLHRLAALKMVLAGEFASTTQELRFRLEAELAARVQHPNIVQVYEIGTYECRPFLALEWVEGGSLASRLDGKPWPPGEAAALIETLARAIDVAHAEGVVHRDLKPANILLAVEGGGWRVEGGGWRVESGGWRVEDGKASRQEKGMTIQSYRELEVWQLGMDLAEEWYRATKGYPKEELFGMTSQIRRAAASIPANIAEGQGREHTKEFLHHLSVARGSLMELETHLMLSQRVGLLDQAKATSLLIQTERVSRMLSGLRKALEKRLRPPSTLHSPPSTQKSRTLVSRSHSKAARR